jgi:Tol biopolymer transport system component
MTTQATAQRTESGARTRSAVLLSLALGTALAGMVALAGTAREAEATFPGTNARITFASERTTGTGVDNPTADSEIFTIKADGTGLKQLTHNTVNDYSPIFSPDGTKIAYDSVGDTTTNPEGDYEIYLMNALDGSGKKNLSNNGYGVRDFTPIFSPDGQSIAYDSSGVHTSNPEGDWEVYRMSAIDGSGQTNLSNNGSAVGDGNADFSPGGTKMAYRSYGIQNSNPEGDQEIYTVNALDGTDQKNLTNNGSGVNEGEPTYSPDGTKIAYGSAGVQTSNLQGDTEVYRMNALDGSGKKNLTNNGSGVRDDAPTFSPNGTKIAYDTEGIQNSNTQGDTEVYVMSALDGSSKKNLSNNGTSVNDYLPIFSPDSKKVAYTSDGVQTSNPQGDEEIYRMNTLDGSSKKNLSNNAEIDGAPDWGRQAM